MLMVLLTRKNLHELTERGTSRLFATVPCWIVLLSLFYFLILIILSDLSRKNTLSCLVNPMKNVLNPTDRTHVKPTAMNLSQPSSTCMRTMMVSIMETASQKKIGYTFFHRLRIFFIGSVNKFRSY